jgi:hypothetical protein
MSHCFLWRGNLLLSKGKDMPLKIVVLYCPDEICTMHTLYPLLKSKHKSLFKFISKPEDVLRLKGKKIVLVFRFLQFGSSNEDTVLFFKKLKDLYEKVIYFDDTPLPRFMLNHIIDYVDIYYKKAILKDLLLYKKEYYSNTLHGDFYHERFGICDPSPSYSKPLTDQQLNKIKLSWNIGIGSFPRTRVRRKLGRYLRGQELIGIMPLILQHPQNYHVPKTKNSLNCPLRLRESSYSKASHYQRVFFVDIAKQKPELFSFGKVPLNIYNKELREAKLTFSPFGHGEVCFRDFEAIINYSLLLKPDMDHMITWPNVYLKNKTYIPLAWDGSDFLEKIVYWRNADSSRIIKNAYEVYMSAFNQHEKRLESILDEIHKI